MSIFNRAYLYIIRKKVRSSILFLIVTLISFFLLSGSVLNTTVNNISKNLYKDVNFGFNIESVDKSNKEIEKDTLKKIEELKGITTKNYIFSKPVTVEGKKVVQENQNITLNDEIKNKSNLVMMNGITASKSNIDFKSEVLKLEKGRHIEENDKKDFYFFDVKDYSKDFESLSQLLDYYYMDIVRESINKNTDRKLFNFINSKINRLNKKINILESELEQANNRDDYKLKGQLLISNIYLFKNKIPETITLQNFYSEDLTDIEIELDPNLTIEKNSEKYFSLYKKNKRTIENLIEQIEIAKQDLGYFETIKFQLENADKTDIAEIKEELIANGILKENIKFNKKKNKNSYLVVYHNGVAIYVGKNNLQNDAITNKLARRDYLWFHAKDIPGSHVVIFDSNPSEETIEVASMLAAYYSKFKNEEYVNVDRTLIKNVKKISGAKPGLVTYTGQKTVKQKIDKNLIGELLMK